MGGAEIQPWGEGAALGMLLAKISLLLLLGWAAHYVLRQSHPRWRVLLWRGVIGGIVLIPLIFFAGPRWQMEVSPIAPALIMPLSLEPEPAAEPGVNPPIEIPSASTTEPAPSLLSSPSQSSVSMPQSNWNPASWIKQNAWLALLAAWGLGVAFFAARLGRASVWVSRIIRTSQPATETAKRMVARVAEDLGARRDVTLRFSPHVPSPFLCGVLRPVIVLPARMRDLDYRDRLPGILAHEVAHLRSHDLPWYATIHGLRVILWFHPLTWRIWSAHAAACEEVSDSVAAAYVGNQETYSKTLASEALEIIARPAGAGGIPMTRTSEIRKRLESLRERWSGRPVSRRRVGAVSCAALLALAALAGMEPVRGSIAGAGDTLSNQESTAALARSITLRKVPDELLSDFGSHMSGLHFFDGNYATGMGDARDLIVRDFTTNTTKILVDNVWAYSSIISPDGKHVAYTILSGDKKEYDLCLIDLDGSNPRTLFRGERSEGSEGLYPEQWSLDGKQILVALEYRDEPDSIQLALISVENGSIHELKKFNGSFSFSSLSPDGKYLAYDLPQQPRASENDIYILSIGDKKETVFEQNPADERFMGWSPDGQWILVTSDRTGTKDLWAVKVNGDRYEGEIKLIFPGIGNITPIRFLADGSFYYLNNMDEFQDIYLAKIDQKTGKLIDKGRSIFGNIKVKSKYPCEWSHNGRYLATVSLKMDDFPNLIPIQTMDSQELRQLSPKLKYLIWDFCWSTNDKYIYGLTWNNETSNDPNATAIYQIDVNTGEASAIIQSTTDAKICALDNSPDGKSLYYTLGYWKSKKASIVMHDLESGSEHEIYVNPEIYPNHISISPDGKWISFITRGSDPTTFTINLIGSSGGEIHELLKLTNVTHITSLEWTPDCQYLFFTKYFSNNGNELWRISVENHSLQLCSETKSENGFMGFRISPDGQNAVYTESLGRNELWVLENFLPREVARAGTQ